MTSAKGLTSDGETVLRVYYGRQELSVGEEWIPFLETLLRTPEFCAKNAMFWAGRDAMPYSWDTVAEYLEVLTDLGILVRKMPVFCRILTPKGQNALTTTVQRAR